MSFPELGPNIARRANPRMMQCARWLLHRLGWGIEGTLPDHRKFVVIGAYHTSNLDFFVGMAFMFALDIRIYWIAKHTIFRWPLAPLLRACGGKPVNRQRHHGMVQEAIDLFQEQEQFVLAITPEGTRSKVERWRTGFYHIAMGAQVVIVPAYFDYPARRIGFGPALVPTGDVEADLAVLHRFYEPYRSRAACPDRV